MSLNSVSLVGRTTRDAELRYTPSNKATATVSIAVNRNFKNANGEREADFINVVFWGKTAENFANWARKGRLVAVTGRIQTRNYENQQGQRVYVTEVVADGFNLLDRDENQPATGNNAPQGQPNNGGNNYNNQQQTPNFARDESPFGNSNPMDISDDDLPF